MEQIATGSAAVDSDGNQAEDYTAPVVLEVGSVTALTLGKKRNDTADGTEYKK